MMPHYVTSAANQAASQFVNRASDLPAPTNDAELKSYVERVFGVRIPDVQVCPHHTTPFRAFADAYFARSSVTLWKASRGFGGKSHLLALLALVEACTLGADVNLLGGSGVQSERVLEAMAKFWAAPSAPRSLLVSEPGKKETRLANGAHLIALMASQRSVRGPHPQRLRMDEIDEMDQAILDAALGQTLARGPVAAQTVLSSTQQYSDGTMSEMQKRAAERGYPIYEWCYKESLQPHGWLPQSEVDRKKNEVTAAMWSAEYENQEPNPASRAIQPGWVESMFDAEYGTFDGALHEYIEIEAPIPGASYTTGADWARKQDFTEIVTFRTDTRPARLVAYLKTGRLDWPVMVGYYNTRVNRYGGQAYHDGTGVGDAVSGYFTVHAEPVIMVGRERANMLTTFISAIEHGDVVAPLIKSLKAQYLYASHEDVFSGGDSHHLPDGIAAGALAWIGVKYRTWTTEEIDRGSHGGIDASKVEPWILEALKASGVDITKLGGTGATPGLLRPGGR